MDYVVSFENLMGCDKNNISIPECLITKKLAYSSEESFASKVLILTLNINIYIQYCTFY